MKLDVQINKDLLNELSDHLGKYRYALDDAISTAFDVINPHYLRFKEQVIIANIKEPKDLVDLSTELSDKHQESWKLMEEAAQLAGYSSNAIFGYAIRSYLDEYNREDEGINYAILEQGFKGFNL